MIKFRCRCDIFVLDCDIPVSLDRSRLTELISGELLQPAFAQPAVVSNSYESTSSSAAASSTAADSSAPASSSSSTWASSSTSSASSSAAQSDFTQALRDWQPGAGFNRLMCVLSNELPSQAEIDSCFSYLCGRVPSARSAAESKRAEFTQFRMHRVLQFQHLLLQKVVDLGLLGDWRPPVRSKRSGRSAEPAAAKSSSSRSIKDEHLECKSADPDEPLSRLSLLMTYQLKSQIVSKNQAPITFGRLVEQTLQRSQIVIRHWISTLNVC
jgi:hypothetical protein